MKSSQFAFKMSDNPIDSLADGNCCFNAFLLAWTQAFINECPHSEPPDFLDEIKRIFGAPSISQDERAWLKNVLLANSHRYQRALSACLRRRVFEYLEAHYFDEGYHENYYRGQLEKLFEMYRVNLEKADDSQHFLAHPFIVKKLTHCANAQDFLSWWGREGYLQYFHELKTPAENATDYARYAGEVELGILSRLFSARIFLEDANELSHLGELAQWSMTLRYAGEHWDFVDVHGKEGPVISPSPKKEEPPSPPLPKVAIPIPLETSMCLHSIAPEESFVSNLLPLWARLVNVVSHPVVTAEEVVSTILKNQPHGPYVLTTSASQVGLTYQVAQSLREHSQMPCYVYVIQGKERQETNDLTELKQSFQALREQALAQQVPDGAILNAPLHRLWEFAEKELEKLTENSVESISKLKEEIKSAYQQQAMQFALAKKIKHGNQSVPLNFEALGWTPIEQWFNEQLVKLSFEKEVLDIPSPPEGVFACVYQGVPYLPAPDKAEVPSFVSASQTWPEADLSFLNQQPGLFNLLDRIEGTIRFAHHHLKPSVKFQGVHPLLHGDIRLTDNIQEPLYVSVFEQRVKDFPERIAIEDGHKKMLEVFRHPIEADNTFAQYIAKPLIKQQKGKPQRLVLGENKKIGVLEFIKENQDKPKYQTTWEQVKQQLKEEPKVLALFEEQFKPVQEEPVLPISDERTTSSETPPSSQASNTSRIEMLIETADQKYQRKDFPGALADLNHALKLEPDNAFALSKRGVLKCRLADYPGGLADLNLALELEPNHALALSTRGEVKRRLKDYSGALADFNRALKLEPDNALALHLRGEVKQAQGDYEGALANFNRALELEPNNAFALGTRGEVKRRLDDHQGALADLNHALELEPNHADALRRRGEVKRLLSDYPGALADFNRALELEPNHAGALRLRGAVKQAQGDDEGALADFNHALELEPNHEVRPRSW